MDNVLEALAVAARNNNLTPPDGFPENMQFSDWNDGMRELMSLLRRAQLDQHLAGSLSNGDISVTTNQTFAALVRGVRLGFSAPAAIDDAPNLNDVKLRTPTRGALRADNLTTGSYYLVAHNGEAFQVLSDLARPNPLNRNHRAVAADDALVRDDFTGVIEITAGSGSYNFTVDIVDDWPVGAFVEFIDLSGSGVTVGIPQNDTFEFIETIRSSGTTVGGARDADGNAIITRAGIGARTVRLYRTGATRWTAIQGPLP